MARKPVRRQPQRTCVGCGGVFAKRELIRIVRGTDGTIAIDETGKMNGRGTYLCRARSCWQSALSGGQIARALKIALTENSLALLEAFAAELAEDSKAVSRERDERDA